ncbi:amidohydrolase [Allobranchiibius sp. CTAmp26]|uniref:amidohydrolase n=1 Tax=Allobranchiibius sp. CTAmp26 TaxID=2815214 RepID=UPI0027DCD4A4|nr:amidohydrolase [Allobranchiibius sp. CTAmp26]
MSSLPTRNSAAFDLPQLVATTVQELTPELVRIRRALHSDPELGFNEVRTTTRVVEALAAAGIEPHTFEGTGLTAEIGAAQPSYRVALRADLDALPIAERTGLDFSSTNDGIAHACGHDVHTSVVLGAGLTLKRFEQELIERDMAVRLVFQPAEEVVPGGAHTAVKEHALDDVDQVFALHCDPSIDVGTVGLKVGAITAACDAIRVRLSGRGGHTSRPHLTGDLTYALAKVVTDVPAALSRRLDPRVGAALVWGTVVAGNAANVIPAMGECVGTLRMLDIDAWEQAGELVQTLVHEVVAPYGVTAEVEYTRGVPPVVNDATAVELLTSACRSAVGPDAVVPTKQSLGGEDFSWMLARAPGAMGRLGTRTPGGPTYELHQGDLVVDERAISVGATLLAATCLLRPDTAADAAV